jgi:hypothetical protein
VHWETAHEFYTELLFYNENSLNEDRRVNVLLLVVHFTKQVFPQAL